MQIKVSDYVVKFLIQKHIKTVFGYPGGVVCHLFDSFKKFENEISLKLNYHEQASSFAACSYALASGNIGAAIATSGPGAVNLVGGICNAWFDSIPVIFITGQVDTYMLKDKLKIRQFGFQETDIVSIVKPVTKYCVRILKPEQIEYELEKACHYALNGRKGPVLIDLPADVQRAFIDKNKVRKYKPNEKCNTDFNHRLILNNLNRAKRPIIIAGAGIKQSGSSELFNKFVQKWQIPVVMSMPSVDAVEYESPYCCGFIGTNGHRYANISLIKSDLIIALGTRLDIKQTGAKRNIFSSDKKLIRVDIDKGELEFKVLKNEVGVNVDLNVFFKKMLEYEVDFASRDKNWLLTVNSIKSKLEFQNDTEIAHKFVRRISNIAGCNVQYTLDVGQNQVWAAQAIEFKKGQNVFMSSGLGTMGYSLPASIGVFEALKKPVIAFAGDGGVQMNIQELQYIAANKIPVYVIVLNNKTLGMIRHFQEKNFSSRYILTTKNTGYHALNFEKAALAYGIKYKKILSVNELEYINFQNITEPMIIEIVLPDTTYLKPNFGKEVIYDQEPQIDRELLKQILNM